MADSLSQGAMDFMGSIENGFLRAGVADLGASVTNFMGTMNKFYSNTKDRFSAMGDFFLLTGIKLKVI